MTKSEALFSCESRQPLLQRARFLEENFELCENSPFFTFSRRWLECINKRKLPSQLSIYSRNLFHQRISNTLMLKQLTLPVITKTAGFIIGQFNLDAHCSINLIRNQAFLQPENNAKKLQCDFTSF